MAITLLPELPPAPPPPPPPYDPTVDQRHDLMFFDPPKALENLPEKSRADLEGWLSSSKDREKDLEYVIIKSYLGDVFHEQNPTPERVEALKGIYAENVLDAPHGATLDNSTFFGMVRDHREVERDRRDLFKATAEAGYTNAITIDPTTLNAKREGFLRSITPDEKGITAPGYHGEDLSALYQTYIHSQDEAEKRVAPLRATAKQVFDSLNTKQKEGDTPFQHILEAAMNLERYNENDVGVIMELVRQHSVKVDKVGAYRKRKETGFFEGVDRSFDQGMDDVGMKLTHAVDRLAEKAGMFDGESHERVRDLTRMLLGFQQGVVNPVVSGGNVFKDVAFSMSRSGPVMGMSAIPGLGIPLSIGYYQQSAYEKFRERGIADDKATWMGLVAGTAMAAVDRYSLKGLGKLAGGTRIAGAMRTLANPLSYVPRKVLTGLGEVGTQFMEEMVQDHVIESGVQEIASLMYGPKTVARPDWGKEWQDALTEAPDVLLTVTGMTMTGLAHGGVKDIMGRRMASSPSLLGALGFNEAQARGIAEAQHPAQALADGLPHRSPMDDAPPGATPGDMARAAIARVRDAQQAATTATDHLFTSTPGVSGVTRTDQGWEVVEDDGTKTVLPTAEAAAGFVNQAGRSASEVDAAAMRNIAGNLGTPNSTSSGNGTLSVSSELERKVRGDGELMILIPGALQVTNADHAALRTGVQALGFQTAGFDGVVEDAGNLVSQFQSGRGADVTGIVQARFEKLAGEGRGTPEQTTNAARALAGMDAFHPDKASFSAERAALERLQQAVSSHATPAELRAIMVELAVADTTGRQRDGSPVPAGRMAAALREATLTETTPDQRAAIQAAAAHFATARAWVKTMHGAAQEYDRSRVAGEIPAGMSFQDYARQRRGEIAAMEPLNGDTATPAQSTPGTKEAPSGTGTQSTGTDANTSSATAADSTATTETAAPAQNADAQAAPAAEAGSPNSQETAADPNASGTSESTGASENTGTSEEAAAAGETNTSENTAPSEDTAAESGTEWQQQLQDTGVSVTEHTTDGRTTHRVTAPDGSTTDHATPEAARRKAEEHVAAFAREARDNVARVLDTLAAQSAAETPSADAPRATGPDAPKPAPRRFFSREGFNTALKNLGPSGKVREGLTGSLFLTKDAVYALGYLIESGVRSFPRWSAAARKHLGNVSSKVLASVYEGYRGRFGKPGPGGMSSPAEVRAHIANEAATESAGVSPASSTAGPPASGSAAPNASASDAAQAPSSGSGTDGHAPASTTPATSPPAIGGRPRLDLSWLWPTSRAKKADAALAASTPTLLKDLQALAVLLNGMGLPGDIANLWDGGPINNPHWQRPGNWPLPKTEGKWLGTPGNSGWKSDKPEVNALTGGRPIQFRDGFIDLAPYTLLQYDFPNLTGFDGDFSLADANLAKVLGLKSVSAAAKWRSKMKLTWHHHQDGKTLQLVPRYLNNGVPHIGGASALKAQASQQTKRNSRSKPKRKPKRK